jgi:hypothetical protein
MLSFLAVLLSGEIGCLAQSSVNIFGDVVPKTPVDPDGRAVTLGVKFTSTQAGKITGIRYYRGQGNSHGYTVALYDRYGKQLAFASVAQDTCSTPCWESVNFQAAVSINANTRYTAAYYTSNGHYAHDQGGLLSNVTNAPLTALANGGVYHYGGGIGFPTSVWNSSNYYVDVLFTPAVQQQQLISGLSLSSSTVAANQPAGTVVGQASVTMNPASPAFSGTLSVATTDPNFQMSGNSLITKAPLAAGSYNTMVTATQSGINDSPLNQAQTVSVTAAPQTIASVSLSGNTFVAGSASGTAIGNVSVAMSPTAPAFSGGLSLSGPDAAGFQIAGSTLQTNGVVPAGSYNINIVASEIGVTNSLFTQSEAITATNGSSLLPPDRNASANWQMAGMLSVGGIPNRTTVCATVSPRGGGQDDAANINNAISACPLGQVVSLSAGTFTINEGSYVALNKGVTVRGAGAGSTILQRTNGAKLDSYIPGSNPTPIILVGTQRYNNGPSTGTALSVDAAQGANSVQVANPAGFAVGQIVLLDEASGASWQPERISAWANIGYTQVWAATDYRVVWTKHNPVYQYVDDFGSTDYPYNSGGPGCWYSNNCDRPTSEIHQVSAVSGNTITFDSPVTISYRVSHQAKLYYWPASQITKNAGVENLTMSNGDDGNLNFLVCVNCWAKNVENTLWLNPGINISNCFRVQLEGTYSHDAAWPVNGGGGYAISIESASSEILVENSISVKANKDIVARAGGAGSVIAYNYMDDAYINGSDGWVEVGLNASHLVGPHHVLFEGNQSFNTDSDQTHGNSIYMTYFRNYLTGYRKPFTALDGIRIDDTTGCCGPLRVASAHAYAYWFSFLGNVLGTPGKMNGWVYEDDGGTNRMPDRAIWVLGWMDITPQGTDPNVASTALRDGNYDYVTNSQKWDPSDTTHSLPNSLYLTQTPAFFNAGSGYTWPWVNPAGSQQLYTLPAKARYDAGTPFKQP